MMRRQVGMLAVWACRGAASRVCDWDSQDGKESVGLNFTESPWTFSIDVACTNLLLSEHRHSRRLDDEGAGALAQALQHVSGLELLDLQGNDIGDEGASAIAGVLPDLPGLTWLDFSSNKIGDAGAEALATAFWHTPRLSGLDVSFNPIGDRGAEALAYTMAAVESSRESTEGFHDILGIDPDILARARTPDEIDFLAPSPPAGRHPRVFDASRFAETLRLSCEEYLAAADADHYLEKALEALGARDVATLRMLDERDIADGLREAGIPVAPRKQISICFRDLVGNEEL